jgi:heme oxygenase
MTSQLAQVLKTSTRPFHDSAEGSQFQSYLTSGQISIADYATYLGQLFLIHGKLETELVSAMKKEARLSQVISDEQLQDAHLRADLVHFGVQPHTVVPLETTARFLQNIDSAASKQPLALLGFHYVLFGSKHGGKFIAKNLSTVHNLNGDGTKYFDPYGSDFMPYWRAFVEKMNKLELSESEVAAIVKAAEQTFVAVGEIGRELEKKGAILKT